MRKGTPPLTYLSAKARSNQTVVTQNEWNGSKESGTRSSAESSTKRSCIEKSMTKHWIDKPKLSGRGETCAVLTDVKGLREVLQSALVFHAVVHEYHELDASIQTDTSNISSCLESLVKTMVGGVYRGDNSVDTNTCKVHAHSHLAEATKNYGSPMGYDANLGERGLQTWAKQISTTAQKCGDATFVTQTANRVADMLLLSKARRSYKQQPTRHQRSPLHMEEGQMWKYTRATCHMTFDLQSRDIETFHSNVPAEPTDDKLLLPQIQSFLRRTHGNSGMVMIWKEILLEPDPGARQYIRAFHSYDKYGKFFDWAQLQDDDTDSSNYVPAKVLLLYKFQGEDFAICWRAARTTAIERRHETNISARWGMEFRNDMKAKIVCVPTAKLSRCLFVFEHIKSKEHLPLLAVSHEQQRQMVIDEAYDRYSWALNCLDRKRWADEEADE
jgi:hypothetical protein